MRRAYYFGGLALLLLITVSILTSIPTRAPSAHADSSVVGEIILVAGDTVDLRWDPTQYPNPYNEPFIRIELFRGKASNYTRILSKSDPKLAYFRDAGLKVDDTFYYYLDVIRKGSDNNEKKYRVFGAVAANTGKVYGEVTKNLVLTSADFDLSAKLTVVDGVIFTIPNYTTLRGTTGNSPVIMLADGGTININGGQFYNHIKVQYGDPNKSVPKGSGTINNVTFTSDSQYGNKPKVEINTQKGVFKLTNNSGLDLTVNGENSVTLEKNQDGSKAAFHDRSVANLKNENKIDITMDGATTGTFDGNLNIGLNLSEFAVVNAKNNGYMDGVVASGSSSVDLFNNTYMRYVVIREDAFASIIKNPNIEEGIRVEGSAKAYIRDNTISSGGIYITGYGSPEGQRKAYAEITGNTVSSPNKLDGIEVYDGAEARVTDNNTIVWTGFHGENEGTVLLTAAGEGTKLTAKDNTIRNGKLFVYGKARVSISGNVIQDPGAAITIGCFICNGDVEGTIEKNTLQNGWGFEVWDASPRLSIKHNCIRGNDPGLRTDDAFLSQNIDVTQNWWGDSSGPYHPTNPGGKGDKIVGAKVSFKPVDPNGSNCKNAPPPAHPPDPSVAGLEVVQTVQSLSNEVPIVAGKPTLVRVYVRSNTTLRGVRVKLDVFRDGALVPVPVSQPRAVTAYWSSDINQFRSNGQRSLNFLLDPKEMIPGTYVFSASLDTSSIPSDRNYNNNTITKTLAVKQRRNLKILYVPIKYQPGGSGTPKYTPTDAQILSTNRFIQNLFPVATIKPHIAPSILWDKDMTGTLSQYGRRHSLLKVLTDIVNNRNKILASAHRYDQVIGILPLPPAPKLPSSCYSDPLWFLGDGLASYCMPLPLAVGHEVGHNFGLRHPDTWDVWNYMEDTYWNDFYSNGTIQEYGFNYLLYQQNPNRAVFPNNSIMPKSLYDFMGAKARPDEWISPLHAKRLYEANGIPQESDDLVQVESTYLDVSGLVNISGDVSFEPIWQITTDQTPTNPPAGTDYCIEFRSDTNSLLDSTCFDLPFFDHELWMDDVNDYFKIMMPKQSGIAAVRLTYGGSTLGQVLVSDNSPEVALISPNGGESLENNVNVKWAGSDTDGGGLFYNLYYSQDNGLSWDLIAQDIQGASYQLDLALIPGSSSAKMKVEVSDGFNITADSSDSTFVVSDKPPSVEILDVVEGGVVRGPVSLIGFAYDPEEGEISGDQLVWTSDVDGELGAGNIVILDSNYEGERTVTLTALDSKGHKSSASVTFTLEINKVFLPKIGSSY